LWYTNTQSEDLAGTIEHSEDVDDTSGISGISGISVISQEAPDSYFSPAVFVSKPVKP